MNDHIYALLRHLPTPNGATSTTYTHNENNAIDQTQIQNMMFDPANIEIISELIIERADPMRNMSSTQTRNQVKDKVNQILRSWKNLGKFDNPMITFERKERPIKAFTNKQLLQIYNREFVNTYAEAIMPASDITKIVSVVNPNGMYAQQTNSIVITSKPIPFYEKALYKRLNAWDIEQQIDETENPFYRLDTNNRMPESEKKKRNTSTNKQQSYLDREGFTYRMIPKY